MIASLVKNEVFKHFANGEFKKAERMLRKLNLKLTNQNTTEDYRLVIYNLAWVQYKMGLHDDAKRNILKIKQIVESDEVFCKNNTENHIKLLGLYVCIFENELTVEENIEINERKYNIFYNNSDYLPEALISKFNIYSLKNNMEGMIDCIESIHNYEMTEENKAMKKRLFETKIGLLKILKEKDINIYKEITEELNNMTDFSIVI